jgi:hypothetical protein
MYSGNQREELSRQSIVRQAVGLNATGRRYFKRVFDAERFIASRKAHRETHAEVGQVNFLQRIEYLTFTIGLSCIYVLDILLFGASAQYVAGLVAGEGDAWAAVAKYVAPACFLGIEVLIGLKIAKSRDEERFGFGNAGARVGWIAIGILVALVMPLAATATAQSAGVVAENNAPVLMITVMAIISFAAHVLVLFAGRLAPEAKAYAAYALIDAFHTRRVQSAIDQAKADLARFNSLFIAYVHAWRAHNARYAMLPSGPFDREVVDLLRSQFPHVAGGGGEASFPRAVEEDAS